VNKINRIEYKNLLENQSNTYLESSHMLELVNLSYSTVKARIMARLALAREAPPILV
jgi:hypothetical protein